MGDIHVEDLLVLSSVLRLTQLLGDIHVEDLLVLSSVLRLTLGRYTCRGPACIVQCFEANSWEIYM